MTKTAAIDTAADNSSVAGQELGQEVLNRLDGQKPDAVIVFASARFDHAALLKTLAETCRPGVLVGSSSAGEFTRGRRGEGSACGLAISLRSCGLPPAWEQP